MKKIVKRILLAIIVAAAVGGGLYYNSMPIIVEYKRLVPKTVELDFTEQGTVVSQKSVEVYALTGGKLSNLKVAEGQLVNAGDVLCMVDDSQYMLDIKQIEANTRALKAQRDNLAVEERRRRNTLESTRRELQSEIHSIDTQKLSASASKEEQLRLKEDQIRLQNIVIKFAEADLARAIDNMVKAELLYTSGALAKNDLDEAKKAVEYAETALDQAKQQIQLIENAADITDTSQYDAMRQALQNQISGIDADLNRSYSEAMYGYYTTLMDANNVSIEKLKKNIEDCAITAPVSGEITELFIEDTNIVGTMSPVALITTEGDNEVEVYVSTKDVDIITPGYRVELQLERRLEDKRYDGTVLNVEDKATVRISALGVEERRVKVTVAPDDVSEFLEGYDVNVRFVYYLSENKLAVPKTSVFTENEQSLVWVVRDGVLQKASVQKGAELRTEFVIDSGLSTGDVVVVDSDSELLKEGVKVKVGE